MSPRDERMIDLRITPVGTAGKVQERCLLRVSAILCLFPERQEIRTIEHSWTLKVCEEDWPKVERAFRSAYLGMSVHAVSIQTVNRQLLEAVKDALAFLDRPDITTYEWYKLAPEHVANFRKAIAQAEENSEPL